MELARTVFLRRIRDLAAQSALYGPWWTPVDRPVISGLPTVSPPPSMGYALLVRAGRSGPPPLSTHFVPTLIFFFHQSGHSIAHSMPWLRDCVGVNLERDVYVGVPECRGYRRDVLARFEQVARPGMTEVSSAIISTGPLLAEPILFTRANEYSWCNPASIALACTKRKSSSRCREVDNGTVELAGGSGTPGPRAE